MYLGELSPIQESQLVQLKSWVSELLKGKVPSDPILLRFLRARDFNVEKAREMLSQSLIWRKKHGVDKILSEYELPPVVNDYFPGGMFFTVLFGLGALVNKTKSLLFLLSSLRVPIALS
mgnify:CR=1 FL=1